MNDRVLLPPPRQKGSPVSVGGLTLRLTPRGQLLCEGADDAAEMDVAVSSRLVVAFAQGSGPGLLQLGAGEIGRTLPPVFVWWRGFAARYMAALCLHGDGAHETVRGPAAIPDIQAPREGELIELLRTAPIMAGIECLTSHILQTLWKDLQTATAAAFASAKADLQTFLKALNPAWNLVGLVHFNLAENRNDPESPFAS
jgi:hypothetical protein